MHLSVCARGLWGKIQIGVTLLDTVIQVTLMPVARLFNTHFYEV